MPAGTFVTTGHTSGSAGAGTPASAVADGAPRLPALIAVNAPPRNARRYIIPASHRGKVVRNLRRGRVSASRPRLAGARLSKGLRRRRDRMRRGRRLAAALTAAARLSRWLGPAPTGPERRIGERIGPTPSANSPHRSLALLERRKGTVFVFRLGIGRAPVIVGAADVGRRQRHGREGD